MAAWSHVTKSISAKKFFISLRIFGGNCNFYHCSLKQLGKYTSYVVCANHSFTDAKNLLQKT
jgi:hypothetical protein